MCALAGTAGMDSGGPAADGSLSARDIVTDIESVSLSAQPPSLSGVQVRAAQAAVCTSLYQKCHSIRG